MGNKKVLLWEIAGIVFIVSIGSLLHFTFDWTKGSPIVGMFSAVNESVWEHLKLGYWSLIIFCLLEYWFIKDETNNFMLAKGLGILCLQGTIVIAFYTYTFFTGKPILFIDISSYIVGTVLCQLVSYLLLTKSSIKKALNFLGLAVLVIHGILLITFTFTPPKVPIFEDSHSHSYGIPSKAP